MLEYYLRKHADRELNISTQSYRTTGYAFVTSRGSELGDRINAALLELAEEDRIGDIIERWLGAQ
jgi:ABC-type amino acid transport substrate-binding protein